MFSKTRHQSLCYFKCTPILCDVLSHQHQTGISFHALLQRFSNGIQHALLFDIGVPRIWFRKQYRCRLPIGIHILNFFRSIGNHWLHLLGQLQFVIDIGLVFMSYGSNFHLCQHTFLHQKLFIIFDGVLAAPFFHQFLGNILRTTCFLMSAHAESHALYQVWFLFAQTVFPHSANGIVHCQYIVTVDHHRFHTIPYSLIRQLAATVLLTNGRTQAISIVFNDKNDRQVPNCCYIKCFMKISLTRSAIPRESYCYQRLFLQLMCQSCSIRQRQLGT